MTDIRMISLTCNYAVNILIDDFSNYPLQL